MKPRAIMMPDSLWESLQQEAEDTGIDTGEYIRKILRDQLNANSKADVVSRIDELEERVDRLVHEKSEDSDSVRQEDQKVAKRDSPAVEEPSEFQTTDNKGSATGKVGDADQHDLITADEFSDEHAENIKEAVNNVIITQFGSDIKQRKMRRKTAAAALEAAINAEEALGRSELVDRFYDDNRYANKDAFWENNVEPVLQEVGTYDNGAGGYVFPDLSPESERVDNVDRDQSERSEQVTQGGQNTPEQGSTTAEEPRVAQIVDAEDDDTEKMDDVDQYDPPIVDESSEEYADYITEALNETLVLREDHDAKQRKIRRETAAAALEAAVNAEEALGRRELVSRFYDDDLYKSRAYFWTNSIRPVLQQVGNYDRGEGGYVFPDLSAESEPVDDIERDQSEESQPVAQDEQRTAEQDPTTAEKAGETQIGIMEEIMTDVMTAVDHEDSPTGNEVGEKSADNITEAVTRVIATREGGDAKQRKIRRETAVAALEAAISAEEVWGRREFVDRFYDDDIYTSEITFWSKDLKPVLQEVGRYDREEGGYVFPEDTQSLDSDNQTTSEPDLPLVDDETREQLEQAVPSSGWVAEQRADEILKMYNMLRQRGEAKKTELLAVADANAAEYTTTESMWSNMVEDSDTLRALPGVEAPPDGKTTWKYSDK